MTVGEKNEKVTVLKKNEFFSKRNDKKSVITNKIGILTKKKVCLNKQFFNVGHSGGGSVGRAVASDTRDPWFKSQHRQSFIYQL